MIRITVSERSYSHYSEATWQIIGELIHNAPDQVTIIDVNSVANYVLDDSTTIGIAKKYLLTQFLDGGQVDSRATRNSLDKISKNEIFILDSRGHDVKLINQVLNALQKTLYFRDEWPAAFVIVVDELECKEVAKALTEKFVVMPKSLDLDDIDRITKQIKRKAIKLRYKKEGYIHGLARIMVEIIRRFLKPLRKK